MGQARGDVSGVGLTVLLTQALDCPPFQGQSSRGAQHGSNSLLRKGAAAAVVEVVGQGAQCSPGVRCGLVGLARADRQGIYFWPVAVVRNIFVVSLLNVLKSNDSWSLWVLTLCCAQF